MTAPDQSDLPLGTVPVEERYELGGRLHRGAHTELVEVRELALDRSLAMRVLGEEGAGDPARREHFVHEALVTASLQHPGVVPVHDLGLDAAGRPFFTMARLRGEPFARFAHGQRRDGGASLLRGVEALVRVCETLAHAHARGVVHGDLGPDDVLLGRRGEVHVLGWGRGGGSAEADVRAVGELLHLLLGGVLPTGGPPPLASICSQALGRGRGSYAGVAELRDDLAAFLEGRVVRAHRTGAAAELQSWIRRHRATAVSLFLVAAVALAALIGVVRVETRERAVQRALGDELRAALAEAVAERDDARDVVRFLAALFGSEAAEGGPIPSADELLDRAARALDVTLARDPEVRARLETGLATAYLGLGRYERARDLLEDSLATAREHLGDDDVRTWTTRRTLAEAFVELGQLDPAVEHGEAVAGWMRAALGREDLRTVEAEDLLARILTAAGRVEEAEELLGQVVERQTALQGAEHEDTLDARANLLALRINTRRTAPSLDEAEDLFRTASRVLADDHVTTLNALVCYSALLRDAGDYPRAEELLRGVRQAWLERLGPDHPHAWAVDHNLALVLDDMNRLEEAEALYGSLYERRRDRIGIAHVATLGTVSNLARMRNLLGRTAEAEELLRTAIEAASDELPRGHRLLLSLRSNLASSLRRNGRLDEAEALARDVLAIRREELGESHPSTCTSLGNTARIVEDSGRAEEAEELYRAALACEKSVPGARPSDVVYALRQLGRHLLDRGLLEEALPVVEEWCETSEDFYGVGAERSLGTVETLARVWIDLGQPERAAPLVERLLQYTPDDHPARPAREALVDEL